jgi:hypothetical protein
MLVIKMFIVLTVVEFFVKICLFSLFLKAEDIWMNGDIKRKD